MPTTTIRGGDTTSTRARQASSSTPPVREFRPREPEPPIDAPEGLATRLFHEEVDHDGPCYIIRAGIGVLVSFGLDAVGWVGYHTLPRLSGQQPHHLSPSGTDLLVILSTLGCFTFFIAVHALVHRREARFIYNVVEGPAEWDPAWDEPEGRS